MIFIVFINKLISLQIYENIFELNYIKLNIIRKNEGVTHGTLRFKIMKHFVLWIIKRRFLFYMKVY